MRTVFLLAAVLALLLTASAAAATKDPRKCSFHNKAACSKQAAVLALRKKEAALLHVASWSADITCTNGSPKFLLWNCTWKSMPTDTPGRGQVKFWATSTGWHTLVTVKAQAVATG